jgi:glycoside/pentoside/hexuronide:cation symporter, GPH family
MARGEDSPHGRRPRLGWATKLAYAFGSVSQAIKTRVISVFLLLYYNQVLGLEAHLVSTLIMATVIIDALVDPVVGQVSDNFRSRLGRRHPFMYAAALPAALLFFLLWNPPTTFGPMVTAGYLLAVLVALKVFDTFFELPALALLPELAEDYDDRTQLVALRQLFSHLANMAIVVLAYQVFLKETPDGGGGVLAAEGYRTLSIVVAVVMFAAILTASVGTHHMIPFLRPAPAVRGGAGQMLREAASTFRNRSFAATALAGMCWAVAIGMKAALDIYWFLYLFGLKQSQIAIVSTVGMAGTVAGMLYGPALVKRFDKKKTAMLLLFAGAFLTVGPAGLWLLGVTPSPGSDAMVLLLSADQFLNSSAGFVVSMCTVAMLADVVEDVEVRTGRRSEGLLFAAENLVKKMVGGMGVFSAGLMLSLVAFPKGAARDAVPETTLAALAIHYVPAVIVLYIAAIAAISLFRITRETHFANLETLRARRGDEPPEAAAAPEAASPGPVLPGGSPAKA